MLRNTRSRLISISPQLMLSRAFYLKWLKRGLSILVDSSIRRHHTERRDKKLAKLELEFHDLMVTWPRDVARLSEVISELGRLWNAKVREEPDEWLAEGDGGQGMEQLRKAAGEIIRRAREEMARARSEEEIHAAFVQGLGEVRRLIAD